MKPSIVALSAALTLGGCTMIPDYQVPDSPVLETVGATEAADSSVTLPGWESLFRDPQLTALVDRALESNRDLRLAMLDVAEAQAQYQIEESGLYPELGISAEGTRQRLPGDLSQTGQSRISSQYSAGLGLASYELDLFGRVRSLEQSALASYFATREARRSAHITLVSEVANAYLTLLADQEKLRISEETVAAQTSSVDLVRQRFDAGLGTELDVRQAEIALETARTNRARLRQQVQEDRHALAVLVGGPVPGVDAEGDLTDPRVAMLREVPEGLSSKALLDRPDIRRAEHQLRAANARIGAARAAFYPSIRLTASAGTASSELSGLFDGGSGTWTFAPSLNLPIFTAGENQANLDLASVRRDQRVAQYEQTIQTAFQEVADALSARRFIGEQLQSQAALVTATQRSLSLAEVRYESGASDYLAVLDARRELLSARQALVSVRLQKLTNRVTLYRALGGGEQTAESTVIGQRQAAPVDNS